jgi:hypothetical protein
MRQRFWHFGLALIAFCTAFAVHAGKQDFILHNETGVEIHELYVSPTKSDDWEEDVLGEDTLPDGESVTITFNDREKTKRWDIKVVDGEGTDVVWNDLKLTEISEVTLYMKKDKVWAEYK